MSEIFVRNITNEDRPEWLRMRLALWPHHRVEDFLIEMDAILSDLLQPVFVAVRADGKLGGFLEAGTRKYAEGCETSPVAYIEGWFVDEDLREQGIGKALVKAAENWARSQGLTEIASDTWLDNEISIRAHLKMGYRETVRLVHFAMKLD